MQFYQFAYDQAFLPMLGTNLGLNFLIYYVGNRVFKSPTLLCSFQRLSIIFVLSYFLYDELVIKTHIANTYRVNINDVFDNGDEFLLKNISFMRKIKYIDEKLPHLVNPNFDLSEVTKIALEEEPNVGKKEQELRGLAYLFDQIGKKLRQTTFL